MEVNLWISLANVGFLKFCTRLWICKQAVKCHLTLETVERTWKFTYYITLSYSSVRTKGQAEPEINMQREACSSLQTSPQLSTLIQSPSEENWGEQLTARILHSCPLFFLKLLLDFIFSMAEPFVKQICFLMLEPNVRTKSLTQPAIPRPQTQRDNITQEGVHHQVDLNNQRCGTKC